jgi:hypothetical protein
VLTRARRRMSYAMVASATEQPSGSGGAAEGHGRARANLSAMISSEVQRTLVKSPPELWAELSDPAALARHLGELGEIRIVRAEPESTVEWEAGSTTGVVSIKPSGWGTKVTLSVTRETVDPGPTQAAEPAVTQAAEPEMTRAAEPDVTRAAEPDAVESDAQPVAEPDAQPAVETEAALTAESDTLAGEIEPKPQPEPRRGFFARLFGRRRTSRQASSPAALGAEPASAAPDPEPAPVAFAAVSRLLEPESFAREHPFAVVAAPAAPAEQVEDISAELMAAESVAAEEVSAEDVTAVLTAVLDRLGAAHHRPFSRS